MHYRRLTLLKLLIALIAILTSVYAILGYYTKSTVRIHDDFINTELKATYNMWQKIAINPWLFSHRPLKILFSNLSNDLDQLLIWMSNKTNKIALLRFSYPWQIMLQNQIYTLVKFGQVYNYIVMVGDEKSLQVCFELNLPCYNGSKYYKNYYKDIDPTVDALFTNKKYYKPMNWFKLRFYFDVLVRNYTILAFDTDIAFSRKNIWLSLEKYSESAGNCDMIFMKEKPINAGFFYSRSNADTIALFNKWVKTEYTHGHLDEQRSFGALRGYYYEICETRDECNIVKRRKMTTIRGNSTKSIETNFVSVRRFPSAYSVYRTGVCPTKKKVDPCLSTSVFLHPVCTVGQPSKMKRLKMNGFWLLREPCVKSQIYFLTENKTASFLNLYRCKPSIYQKTDVEREFEKCKNEMAWTK